MILEPPEIKSVTVSTVSPSISHGVMGPDARILVFWMLSFNLTFSLSYFTVIKRLFSSSMLSSIKVVHGRREWQTTPVFLPWEQWTVWKGKKIGHWKMNSPGLLAPNMLLEKTREITPERMKRWSQSENNAQLWMWLVMEVKSDTVKSSIAQEPEMLGPWIKANWKW